MKIITKSGFTLVEAMVVVLLSAMVIGGIYTTLLIGNSSWENYEAAVTVQQEARRAVAFIARDMRTATNLTVKYSADSLAATFNHPQDGAVRYSWLRHGEPPGQLLRQDKNGSRIIGKYISAFVISESRDAVSCSITTSRVSRQGKELNFALSHRVAKR